MTSPYEEKYIDVKVIGDVSGSVTITVEEGLSICKHPPQGTFFMRKIISCRAYGEKNISLLMGLCILWVGYSQRGFSLFTLISLLFYPLCWVIPFVQLISFSLGSIPALASNLSCLWSYSVTLSSNC